MGLKKTLLILLGMSASLVLAAPLVAPTLLPVEFAFRPSVTRVGETVHIEFHIASDYYLYKERFRVLDAKHQALPLNLPTGESLEDPVIGGTHEIYRQHLEWILTPPPGSPSIELYWQGCAEKIGVCFPMQHRVFSLPN